jgi:DNA polymerase-3 subunit epsilon
MVHFGLTRYKIRLWALGAPFGKKDVLKQRKYRWNTGEKEGHKSWYIDLPEDEVDNELTYLRTHIFSQGIRDLPMDRLSSKLRYSNRI